MLRPRLDRSESDILRCKDGSGFLSRDFEPFHTFCSLPFVRLDMDGLRFSGEHRPEAGGSPMAPLQPISAVHDQGKVEQRKVKGRGNRDSRVSQLVHDA
jgi:hypothetical protein